jgi:hypothetical protein
MPLPARIEAETEPQPPNQLTKVAFDQSSARIGCTGSVRGTLPGCSKLAPRTHLPHWAHIEVIR